MKSTPHTRDPYGGTINDPPHNRCGRVRKRHNKLTLPNTKQTAQQITEDNESTHPSLITHTSTRARRASISGQAALLGSRTVPNNCGYTVVKARRVIVGYNTEAIVSHGATGKCSTKTSEQDKVLREATMGGFGDRIVEGKNNHEGHSIGGSCAFRYMKGSLNPP